MGPDTYSSGELVRDQDGGVTTRSVLEGVLVAFTLNQLKLGVAEEEIERLKDHAANNATLRCHIDELELMLDEKRDEIERLRKALRAYVDWFGAEVSTVRSQYLHETGEYAPGSDIPPSVNPSDEKADIHRRVDLWNKWLDARREAILQQAIAALEEGEERLKR